MRYGVPLFGGSMGWLNEYIRAIRNPVLRFLATFVNAVLRGIAQVVFINNPITGILILAGAFVSSRYIALMGLLGCGVGTLTAEFIQMPRAKIDNGLFGFNGYLIGGGMGLFQAGWDGATEWNPLAIVGAIICSCLGIFIQLALGFVLSHIPNQVGFTFPFQAITWIWLFASQTSSHFPMADFLRNNAINTAGGNASTSADDRHLVHYDTEELFKGIVKGVGQIYFMDHFWSGVLILIGMVINSGIATAGVVIGSAAGVAYATFSGQPHAAIYAGLWGYNPALTGIVLFGMFFVLTWKVAILTVPATLLSAIMHGTVSNYMARFGMPTLTFPFAMGSLIFTLIGSIVPCMEPVPLMHMTIPEEHLDRPWEADSKSDSTDSMEMGILSGEKKGKKGKDGKHIPSDSRKIFVSSSMTKRSSTSSSNSVVVIKTVCV